MSEKTTTMIATTSLDFDPENPRFYRLNTLGTNIVEEMLEHEGVQDLMLSIGQKGYFPGEPLLVTQQDGKFIVVEGNRRLAAVKLLNGEIPLPPRRKSSLTEIIHNAQETPPEELPCFVYKDRKDILRYLGYRHITGIKEWDALSKAKYLSQLRTDFYADLVAEEQMKALARDIGSRSDYVAQLLTALSLYIKAEESRFYDLPMLPDRDIEFSLITTALSYSNICSWLGLKDRKDIEMPGLDEGNLKRLFAWMFVKDQQGNTILGESRNLKEMAAVVARPEAVKVLEETKKLAEAYLYTDGPEEALNNALSEAADRISVVWNMLPKTRPWTSEHFEKAKEMFDNVKLIRNFLQEKLDDN